MIRCDTHIKEVDIAIGFELLQRLLYLKTPKIIAQNIMSVIV